MWTSPVSEAYASHAQAPASSCESVKEGSLCEVEAPPYWYSLSLSSLTCYLHEVLGAPCPAVG